MRECIIYDLAVLTASGDVQIQVGCIHNDHARTWPTLSPLPLAAAGIMSHCDSGATQLPSDNKHRREEVRFDDPEKKQSVLSAVK